MKPDDLIGTIQERLDGNLESIVLYGSAASGQYQAKFSNYNLLILTKKELQTNPLAGCKMLKKWLQINPPPLFWDVQFFQNSVDVFPLEFLEIQQHHKILFGKPLPPFEVRLKNLRHQLEMEFRTKVLALQNNPAHLFDKPRDLNEVLLKSLPSILTLMKGLLWLLKKAPEEDWKKRVQQVALLTDIHPEVFLNLINIRQERLPPLRKNEALEVFEVFLTELRVLIRFVDQSESVGTTRPAIGGTPSP